MDMIVSRNFDSHNWISWNC